MNPSLQGYAAAVLGELDAATLAVVTDELGSLDHAISANHELRAAMTDTSVPGAQRRAVLADVLEGKVAVATSRLASNAALVSQAQDVPAAIGYLVSRARQASSGEHVDEGILSVLAARKRVGGFATALFEQLEVADLEEIEDGLFRFARIIESSPDLRRVLADRDMPVQRRQAIVHALVEHKATSSVVALLDYVVAGGRARDIVGTLDWLVDQTARARGWRVAKVRTAQPLSETQADSLRSSLTELAGNPVELQITEDATLLGGIRVEVGDLLVDATAKARLAQLREHLEADHRTYAKND
jgi:F-type H+-transporting ATPase subunit delta